MPEDSIGPPKKSPAICWIVGVNTEVITWSEPLPVRPLKWDGDSPVAARSVERVFHILDGEPRADVPTLCGVEYGAEPVQEWHGEPIRGCETCFRLRGDRAAERVSDRIKRGMK